jgi:hypothetical protein
LGGDSNTCCSCSPRVSSIGLDARRVLSPEVGEVTGSTLMLLGATVYPAYHPWIMGKYSVGFPQSFLQKKKMFGVKFLNLHKKSDSQKFYNVLGVRLFTQVFFL